MRRIGQIALLLVAGVAVAALAIGYTENQSSPLVPSGRWLGWGVYTILIFTTLALEFRSSWSRVGLWLTFSGLCLAHALGYFVAFSQLEQWRSIWFLPITFVEYSVFLLVVDWLGYGRRGHGKNRAG